MAKTYRMPDVPVQPGDKDFPTVPITTMPPRSWITSHANGARIEPGKPIALRGIAIGGDCGVAKVEVTANDRAPSAALAANEGAFGFRAWTVTLPPASEPLEIGVRCTNNDGVTQPDAQAWNPSGYARNVAERITLLPA
jgi:hypothetical protein